MSADASLLADPEGLSWGLAQVGFVLAVLAHGAYAVYLLSAGLRSRPLERSARPYLLAVLATVAWGLAGLADLNSSKVIFWHLAGLFDLLRYAGWVVFLLLLYLWSNP